VWWLLGHQLLAPPGETAVVVQPGLLPLFVMSCLDLQTHNVTAINNCSDE